MQAEATPMVFLDVEIGDDVVLGLPARAFRVVLGGYQCHVERTLCLAQCAVLLSVVEYHNALMQLVEY